MNKILKVLGNIYLSVMLIVYPLIMTDKYFNVTDTKLYCFYVATMVFSLVTLAIVYFKWLKNDAIQISIKQFAFVIPILFLIITAFYSTGDVMSAVGAFVEYGVGVAFLLVLALGMIALRIAGYNREVYYVAAVLGGIVAVSLGLLQFLGVDLFGLIKSIVIDDSNLFISTIGNISFFGAYICLIFPISAYGFLEEKEYRNVAAIGVIASTMGVIIANTEATLMAFIIELILIMLIKIDNDDSLKMRLWLINLVAIAVMLFDGSAWLSTSERTLFGLQKSFINPLVWCLIFFISLVLIRLVNVQTFLLIRKILKGASIILLILIVCMPLISIVYTKLTYINMNSPISRLLYFDDNWGNRRGYIWKRTIELYSEGSVNQKMFGRGIGSFLRDFPTVYGDESVNLYYTVFDDAHNMFLQILFEYGLVGVISVIFFICIIFYQLIKRRVIFEFYRAVSFVGLLVCSSCLVVQNITPAFLVLFV